MAEISAENSSTIIFPIPVELLEGFQAMAALGNPAPVVVADPTRPVPVADDAT